MANSSPRAGGRESPTYGLATPERSEKNAIWRETRVAIKNVVKPGESVVKHEFVYEKNGVTTFECRELISRQANGAENICVFKAVFGPREEHAKHKHTTCDEIVYCVSGRGVEGIEVAPGKFEEFEYFPGMTLHLPTGVGHYTRNPDYFEHLLLIGIFVGVPDMNKETTGYVSLGSITDADKTVA